MYELTFHDQEGIASSKRNKRVKHISSFFVITIVNNACAHLKNQQC